ncbi:MAG: hypothetical protein ACK4Y6_07935 [Bacteroidota bacterium]|jgi:hypothetical protein
MKSLNPNWFYQDLPDFEYKKYVLLAYLNNVHKQFNETRLYPGLADLVMHYRTLIEFRKNHEQFYSSFPDTLERIDLTDFTRAFSKAVEDDMLMKHIEEVVNYAIPAIRKHLDEGKEIYEFMEKEIAMYPVGILPLYKMEGYMFIRDGDSTEIKVYEYGIKFFQHEHSSYRAVNTEYVTSYRRSMVNTSENIKIELIRTRKKLPNPAAFSVETNYEYPLQETIIPIAKRLLMQYVQ